MISDIIYPSRTAARGISFVKTDKNQLGFLYLITTVWFYCTNYVFADCA